ncbi:anaphase-promoting complex subunit 11 RING-H2 finger-domain-containing protein [Mycena amicta]|nr:anaphase-promoting complex subunit 11 RING-H2 finger-domain-containing protein [Mycena amicta]
MQVTIKHWHAVAQWRWDTGADHNDSDSTSDDDDVCGICRVPYEGCCPSCKVPGDDCPLIWGECSHWLGTPTSKQQCPMDRRAWVTAERKSQHVVDAPISIRLCWLDPSPQLPPPPRPPTPTPTPNLRRPSMRTTHVRQLVM